MLRATDAMNFGDSKFPYIVLLRDSRSKLNLRPPLNAIEPRMMRKTSE